MGNQAVEQARQQDEAERAELVAKAEHKQAVKTRAAAILLEQEAQAEAERMKRAKG
ncbi:MAG: hypothetical protein ACE5EM_02250 [Sphingomonadales bacterium]